VGDANLACRQKLEQLRGLPCRILVAAIGHKELLAEVIRRSPASAGIAQPLYAPQALLASCLLPSFRRCIRLEVQHRKQDPLRS